MIVRPAAYGGGMLKVLVSVVIIALLVVLAFATSANWKRTGVLSFHVFDSAWWTVGREEAQPLVDKTVEKTREAYGKLWGEGGVIDEADKWLRQSKDTPPPAVQPPAGSSPASPPTSATKPPEGPSEKPVALTPPPRSAETKRYEDRILAARGVFEDGVESYRKANPAEGGWTEEKKRSVQHARNQFAKVREMLADAVPAYEARPDHDRAIAQRARELQRLDQQLFYNANKMSGGL